MQYIFFHLYNRMYQDGKHDKAHPELDAFKILLVGTVLWIMILLELYSFYILKTVYSEKVFGLELIIDILIGSLLYIRLIKNKKYELIYDKFKDISKQKKRIGLLVSILYAFLPFFIVIFLALKFNGKI